MKHYLFWNQPYTILLHSPTSPSAHPLSYVTSTEVIPASPQELSSPGMELAVVLLLIMPLHYCLTLLLTLFSDLDWGGGCRGQPFIFPRGHMRRETSTVVEGRTNKQIKNIGLILSVINHRNGTVSSAEIYFDNVILNLTQVTFSRNVCFCNDCQNCEAV